MEGSFKQGTKTALANHQETASCILKASCPFNIVSGDMMATIEPLLSSLAARKKDQGK